MSRIIIPTQSIGQALDTLPPAPDEGLAAVCQGIRQLSDQGIDLRQPIGIDAVGLYVIVRDLLRFRALSRSLDPNTTDLTSLRLRALLPEYQETGDSNGTH